MSYSRWGASVWYSYYCSSPSTERNGQIFFANYDIERSVDWTYAEIMDLFSHEDKDIMNKLITVYSCNEAEAMELMDYMQLFLEDVKEDFSI